MKKFILAIAAVTALSTAAYAENSDAAQFGVDNPGTVYETIIPTTGHVKKLKMHQNSTLQSGTTNTLNGAYQPLNDEETSRNSQ